MIFIGHQFNFFATLLCNILCFFFCIKFSDVSDYLVDLIDIIIHSTWTQKIDDTIIRISFFLCWQNLLRDQHLFHRQGHRIMVSFLEHGDHPHHLLLFEQDQVYNQLICDRSTYHLIHPCLIHLMYHLSAKSFHLWLFVLWRDFRADIRALDESICIFIGLTTSYSVH